MNASYQLATQVPALVERVISTTRRNSAMAQRQWRTRRWLAIESWFRKTSGRHYEKKWMKVSCDTWWPKVDQTQVLSRTPSYGTKVDYTQVWAKWHARAAETTHIDLVCSRDRIGLGLVIRFQETTRERQELDCTCDARQLCGCEWERAVWKFQGWRSTWESPGCINSCPLCLANLTHTKTLIVT